MSMRMPPPERRRREDVNTAFKATLKRYDGDITEDSDYEIMHIESNNVFRELYIQRKYFSTSTEFHPSAPYYSELQTQILMGSVPLSSTGKMNMTIKLEDIMSEEHLQLYIDSGVSLFRITNTNVTIVSPQFTSQFYGSVTHKVIQGEYFDTQLTEVHEDYIIELNKGITGIEFELPTNIEDPLKSPLLKIDVSWNLLKVPRSLSADFPDGTRVYKNMLLKIMLQPIMPVARAPNPSDLDASSLNFNIYRPSTDDGPLDNLHKVPIKKTSI